jgi:ABC-type transport system involved in cytochrome bd biosynthesis fused ATPase/permease subunit
LVQSAIDRLIQRGGCTVVLVAHRLSTVVNADQIGVVYKSRNVGCGNQQELMKTTDVVYHKLVAHQIANEANVVKEGKADDTSSDNIDALIDAMETDNMAEVE